MPHTRGAAAPQRAESSSGVQYGNEVRGLHVRVYWAGDCVWFKGKVMDYSPAMGKHLVQYEDNDTGWLILAEEERLNQLQWVDEPTPLAKRPRALPRETQRAELQLALVRRGGPDDPGRRGPQARLRETRDGHVEVYPSRVVDVLDLLLELEQRFKSRLRGLRRVAGDGQQPSNRIAFCCGRAVEPVDCLALQREREEHDS